MGKLIVSGYNQRGDDRSKPEASFCRSSFVDGLFGLLGLWARCVHSETTTRSVRIGELALVIRLTVLPLSSQFSKVLTR